MENAAFTEGYRANGYGKPRYKNPYNDNPFMIFRSEWFKGWDASQSETDRFNEVIQPKE